MCSSDLAMNVTSAPAPAGVDEAAVAGLEMVPSRLVRPPRAKASPVHLECRYLQTVDLPSAVPGTRNAVVRSEEHTSELQSLMRISYAVFCLKKKKQTATNKHLTSVVNY